MRKIEVDDEVFAYLQQHAEPFVDTVNTVLRRLLLSGGTKPPAKRGRSSAPGDLAEMVKDGRLLAGDELEHSQPRKGLVHKAVVREDGWIVLPTGEEYAKPSPALKACVGNEINGWGNWIVVRTRQRLQDLRHS